MKVVYLVEALVVGDGIGERWSFVSAHRTQEGAALLMMQLRAKESRNPEGELDIFRVDGPHEVMP